MKNLKLFFILSLTFSIYSCSPSGTSSAPTAPSPVAGNPSADSTGSDDMNQLLTKHQIAEAKFKISKTTGLVTLNGERLQTKKYLVGAILQETLSEIYPIDWNVITDSELSTLISYFFDKDLNLLK